MQLVLASGSPRRRELLLEAGIDCEIDPAAVDETPRVAESPYNFVERLAREKADVIARRHRGQPVLAADTAVVVAGDILGKPRDARDAAGMLRRLSGQTHEVLTGVALAWEGAVTSRVERAVVRFAAIDEAMVAAYVLTGEPMDKAGVYAIQGGASRFVTALEGSRDTVIGLPIWAVLELLQARGLHADASGRIL